MNLLHFLCHENMSFCVQNALKSGCSFIIDQNNCSPLSYSLERNSIQSIDDLLGYCCETRDIQVLRTLNHAELC